MSSEREEIVVEAEEASDTSSALDPFAQLEKARKLFFCFHCNWLCNHIRTNSF